MPHRVCYIERWCITVDIFESMTMVNMWIPQSNHKHEVQCETKSWRKGEIYVLYAHAYKAVGYNRWQEVAPYQSEHYMDILRQLLLQDFDGYLGDTETEVDSECGEPNLKHHRADLIGDGLL